MKIRPAFYVVLLTFCSIHSFTQDSSKAVRITVPGTAGALEFVAPGNFQQRVRPDGKEVQARARDDSNGLMMTAFLQRVDFKPSPAECRKQWWGTTTEPPQMHRENIRLSESGPMARVDYDVPVAQGIKVNQHSVHVYLGGGSECAEIHLSVVQYTPAKDTLFSDFLKTVRLISDVPAAASAAAPAPESPAMGNTQEMFAKASRFYLEKNYKMAALYYQGVLDSEKQSPTLNEQYFEVLVDNLGMSYGIDGDLAKAKTTFEYGISKKPKYPLFYYNLACTYGERGEMQPAIAQLREAYRNKANMIAGEEFPDPMTDDSFRTFAYKKTFVDAVASMKQGR